jgi:phosphate:Na+ symporter
LQGTAKAASEVPRQIANANTLFNVINTLLFIGFSVWFAKLAERLVPERKTPAGVIAEPEFLDDSALAVPAVALQQARLEVGRIGGIALAMLNDLGPALKDRDMARVQAVARRDDEIDILEAEILRYLGRIRTGMLTEEESKELERLMAATDNIESLADVIETDIVALARKAADISSVSGEETRAKLAEIYLSVVAAFEHAVKAIQDNDQQAAESALMMKSTIREQTESFLGWRAARLSADDPDYLKLVRLQMSFVDQMRRIYTLTKRIAKVALPPALAQQV